MGIAMEAVAQPAKLLELFSVLAQLLGAPVVPLTAIPSGSPGFLLDLGTHFKRPSGTPDLKPPFLVPLVTSLGSDASPSMR